jgi:predicted transcriptional regulator
MAAELARQLLEQGKIDLVLCFAPSCQVVDGFRSTFSAVLGRRLDGLIGAVGAASTYQARNTRMKPSGGFSTTTACLQYSTRSITAPDTIRF